MNGATGKTDGGRPASRASIGGTHGVSSLDWSATQSALKRDDEALRSDLEQIPDGDIRSAKGTAMLVHPACHLGAIRQLLLLSTIGQIAD